ncbi:beta-CASP ribonuclease aCPSF1 [Candidatus Micrarchaeota archaeon]|nr:beta-CASP ribonuclease aCPSF1 [Candidatus Micrarchaeota archaeon]
MHYKEIEKVVNDIMPEKCRVTKVEAEGLNIVIYVKDIREFYANDQLIKQLAGSLRKKVSVRVDASMLMDMEEAKKKIHEIVSEDAQISEIMFSPEFSEVHIEALKPGLVIGKGGTILKEIITSTGWSPVVLRMPTIPSSTLKGIRKSMVADGEERKKFLISVGKRICQNAPQSEWVRAVMLGAFREVGRSCTLVQTANSKILIDVGINPVTGEPSKAYPYLDMMGFSLDKLDAVIVTHGHMDHMGFVPYLYAYGYEGPVYCTHPTRDLMGLLQKDYLNLAKKSLGVDPPYTKKDIQNELKRVIPVEYGEVVDITPEIKMTLYNAGHIIGSAMVHLHIGEGLHNFVHTGDMKFGYTKLFDPANTNFPRVETLFIESTYGGRNDITANRRQMEDRLVSIIKETAQRGGKTLIPVFAVGRSQEIMLVLEDYYRREETGFDLPVYIDGMVLEASAIHTAYPEYLRKNVERRILSNNSPFESPMIKVAKGTDRKEIVDGEPCVILAPSGMLTGGPSVEYLNLMAEDERNTLVFVGYQSPLSLGHKIQKGMKEIPLTGEDGKTKVMNINMRVETVEGFSGHSDRHQLMAFLKNLRPTPERVFTVHGDWGKTEDLARSMGAMIKREARAPMNLEAIRLK